MGEAIIEGKDGLARALIRVAEPFHAVTYYARELTDWTDAGYKGWWHAYFGYRPAPMGAVSAGTVAAAFYNFAPRMVKRAVPGVWDIRTPAETSELRLGRISVAFGRIFGGDADATRRAVDGASLIRSVADCGAAGRPVFAAYAELDWPDDPTLALWHGCTLLREHRGDSHNVALAAAGIDGVECHVLMAGKGHGNRPTILAIRGWNEDEWAGAVERLASRGWCTENGELTEEGHAARTAIERHTDELFSESVSVIGVKQTERLIEGMRPMVDHLAAAGEVSGRWPPEHLLKPDPGP